MIFVVKDGKESKLMFEASSVQCREDEVIAHTVERTKTYRVIARCSTTEKSKQLLDEIITHVGTNGNNKPFEVAYDGAEIMIPTEK